MRTVYWKLLLILCGTFFQRVYSISVISLYELTPVTCTDYVYDTYMAFLSSVDFGSINHHHISLCGKHKLGPSHTSWRKIFLWFGSSWWWVIKLSLFIAFIPYDYKKNAILCNVSVTHSTIIQKRISSFKFLISFRNFQCFFGINYTLQTWTLKQLLTSY